MDDHIYVFLELPCFPLQHTSLYFPQSSFYSHKPEAINFSSCKKFGLANIGQTGCDMNATLERSHQLILPWKFFT
jgi:hypothetical protein